MTGGGISNVIKVSPVDHSTEEDMKWLTTSGLTIVVVGASGDLAKKKTYPSLLDLYDGMNYPLVHVGCILLLLNHSNHTHCSTSLFFLVSVDTSLQTIFCQKRQ